MLGWIPVIPVVGSLAVLVVLLFVYQRCCCIKQQKKFVERDTERAENNIPNGITKGRTNNYYVLRHDVSSKHLFSWGDHPSLITDAVENGWSRFAFTTYMSSPSIRSTCSILGGVCAADLGTEMEVETSWEVCQGSVDLMQKIKLNSGLKNINMINYSSMGAISVIKTALPLPGPPLGNSSFPQEAYFEITILCCDGEGDHDLVGKVKKSKVEGEKTKLIQENSNAKSNSDSLVHNINGSHGHGNNKLEELQIGSKDCGQGEVIMMSLGLAAGGSLPLKLPGSYPGSIGFNSDGSVYLDGIKLVLESEIKEWGRTNRVIGCGYNSSQRKVFFTVDSELVHVIHCKPEEFGTPLYPTLAANTDIEVLVNFGQSSFKYASANSHRTPNPCFIGPLSTSPSLGYEDSKEFFSMGRIDSQWRNRGSTRNTNNNGNGNNKTVLDFDEESEGDLFEIVLDSCGRSPHSSLHQKDANNR